MNYSVLFDLALILFSAKLFGMIARKIHIPQVVGEILAGLLIGPNILGLVNNNDVITYLAEIGVIMIMFVAGLETDIREIKKSGITALLVASCGVLIPLVCGYLLYSFVYGFAFIGSERFIQALFVGTIITATSVSITVEVLRELGKLKTKVGTVVLSAAIIDDVIGIILLSFVCGMKNADAKPSVVIVKTLLFIVFSIAVGITAHKLFKWLDKKNPHRRRWPIFSLAFCLLMAYIAESVFSIADITGAFLAGVIFCNIQDSEYIAKKVDINSYMFFSPIFFTAIGIRNVITVSSDILLFSVLFVIIALMSKIVGCGGMAKLNKFSTKDALKVGVGMMARGEVALIVAQKGVNSGVLGAEFFTPVILLIMTSSVITPIILKLLYKDELV